MSANDELAGRMARQAAEIAYRVCAETRHVTLGDKCREAILAAAPPVAPPRPARIPWVPIADMPEAWKDGREVLAWVGRPVILRWADRFAAVYGDTSPGWYLREDDDRAYPTHVAEINPPEGL